ncbi:MAG: MOSC domain-containing protein [Ignavibacteriales bacterium]|nr:MOSC domain-containing protein [Ignavibacteriales bacterium]
MTAAGFVASLQICPGHRKPMWPLHEVLARTNHGLEGDLHALDESPRQVLLIEGETLDALGLPPGSVKENITTRNIALMSLSRNQLLMVGGVRLQITSICKPCNRLEELRPGLRATLEGRRGMLARVVRGGVIRQGDAIELL